MNTLQTLIWQHDGILIIKCVGSLDESQSPAIFARILQYAREAPQIVVVDLSQVQSIKTAFVQWIVEVHSHLHASGGAIIIVPGEHRDVLDMTGISSQLQIIDSFDDALAYARGHFPHIIDFIREQKSKQDLQTVSAGIKNLDDWVFFSDTEKKIPNLQKILEYAIESRASDIHLHVGKPLTYRIEWVIKKIDTEPLLTDEHMSAIKTGLLSQYPISLETLEAHHDVDFGYISEKDRISFRVNGYWNLWHCAFTLRRIEQQAKNIADLGLPQAVDQFLHAKQWLVLITGPTGSGKSTTLVAVLEAINATRSEHIITIEDPIEFIFSDQKSIFSQREVGRDTESFVHAIRAAMREDPDIVMIGEMRDATTVEAALNLAETGHLVFSTLHTSGSVQTISRILQFFPADDQKHICGRLADSLLGVLSQRLLMRRDGVQKRIAMFELMFSTSGIKNLIRSGDLGQLNNAIETGRSQGMIPMKLSAQELEQKGIIRREDYEGFFTPDML